MSIFYCGKYSDYTVGLKKGYKEIVNGYPVVHKPVRAKFENHIFDTESSKAKRLPMSEDEIRKKLRKNDFFGIDYVEQGKPPITLNKLMEDGIRDIREYIDEVDDMTMLKKAIDKELEKEGIEGEEPRKTAIEEFKKRLKTLMGDIE
jgi:hypothetical protein